MEAVDSRASRLLAARAPHSAREWPPRLLRGLRSATRPGNAPEAEGLPSPPVLAPLAGAAGENPRAPHVASAVPEFSWRISMFGKRLCTMMTACVHAPDFCTPSYRDLLTFSSGAAVGGKSMIIEPAAPSDSATAPRPQVGVLAQFGHPRQARPGHRLSAPPPRRRIARRPPSPRCAPCMCM